MDSGVTGEAIAHTIESAVLDCHLDPTKIRGQAYDGASSMSGKYKGCAAVLERKYPKAKYQWRRKLLQTGGADHAVKLVCMHVRTTTWTSNSSLSL